MSGKQFSTDSTWKDFLAFLRKPKQKVRYDAKLGVLAIMKNEALNLDEWIEHYLWMGAGRIFLIDNGSTDDTVAKARAWVTRGRVELVIYPQRHQQERHYRTAVRHFRIAEKCEWLLVADLDEFWFCPAGDRLDQALAEFRGYDVIYSNWVMFGSAGLIDHPDSVREGFTLRRPGVAGHNESKYFCRTRVLKDGALPGIHKVRGADSARTVSDTQRFQLNHYPIQSEAFFKAVKMTRGASDNAQSDSIRDLDYFRRYDEGCDHPDRRLADLVAAARIR
ncbi:MAG: glycosyltransferase family 2 protein [Rhodobacterales bacterium]|nr:glycosyltransferase family 2 protein [Rhodobacterales bacterium]